MLLSQGWRPSNNRKSRKKNKPPRRQPQPQSNEQHQQHQQPNEMPTRKSKCKRRQRQRLNNEQNRAHRQRHQEKFKEVPRKYPGHEFTIVPIYSFKRQHISVDRNVFYWLLSSVKCQHPAFRTIPNGPKKSEGQITHTEWATLWREYFNIDRLTHDAQNSPNQAIIEFEECLMTNGQADSFVMRRTTPLDVDGQQQDPNKTAEQIAAEKIERQRLVERGKIEEAEQLIALDIGDKLPFSGIRRLEDGTEINIRKTNREFHNDTNSRRRTIRMRKLSHDIDEEMRQDRERLARLNGNHEQPGPRSENYLEYAEHIIKYFNDAIATYTSAEYTLQTFLAWSEMNRGLDKMAKQLINGKKVSKVFLFFFFYQFF